MLGGGGEDSSLQRGERRRDAAGHDDDLRVEAVDDRGQHCAERVTRLVDDRRRHRIPCAARPKTSAASLVSPAVVSDRSRAASAMPRPLA